MKIIKKGRAAIFVCNSCGCEFAVGINVVHTPDGGENYYACCPGCGDECHTDCAKMENDKKDGDNKCRPNYCSG